MWKWGIKENRVTFFVDYISDKILEGVPEEEKALIVGGNAAKLYDFN